MFTPWCFQAAGAAIPPVLSSLNYDLADTLGGDSITITGTSLGSAVSCTVGGTSASITANTPTSLTFTMPAKTAGTYNVQVTTAGGSSNTLAIEAWAPDTDATCTLLLEKPGYNTGSGTWAARVGTNATGSPASPTFGGAPVFDGTGYLDSANLASYINASGGTVAAVASSTNNTSLSITSPYDNPNLLTNATQGTLGLSRGALASVNGWMFHVYDSTAYRTAHVSLADTTGMHSVIGRFDASSLDLIVDNGTPVAASPAPTAGWGTTSGASRIGANWDAAKSFRGTCNAFCLLNAKASSTFVTKFHKWSRVRHGVS